MSSEGCQPGSRLAGRSSRGNPERRQAQRHVARMGEHGAEESGYSTAQNNIVQKCEKRVVQIERVVCSVSRGGAHGDSARRTAQVRNMLGTGIGVAPRLHRIGPAVHDRLKGYNDLKNKLFVEIEHANVRAHSVLLSCEPDAEFYALIICKYFCTAALNGTYFLLLQLLKNLPPPDF